MRPTLALLCATAALATMAIRADSSADDVASFSPYVDAEGVISRPVGFRDGWVHLGTWFVEDDEQAKGPGIHDVYAQREHVEGFRERGTWPDGSVLVKTVRGTRAGAKTTGNAHWAGDVEVWFVMVRDRENRFPENQAWGEGWGWALFEADAPMKNATTTWKGTGFNNCFGCHVPARGTEWVFIEGYPTLRDAARYGE